MFYEMLIQKHHTRGNMEPVYANHFNFDNRKSIWENIYKQQIIDIEIPKLREFNYKLIHNIVPCGQTLAKWKNIDSTCQFCRELESIKHMLFDCPRVSLLWTRLSNIIKCDITWKHVVCGFPSYKNTTNIKCLNYMICITAYAIFKANSKCKFDGVCYKNINLHCKVKNTLIYYCCLLKEIHPMFSSLSVYRNILENM